MRLIGLIAAVLALWAAQALAGGDAQPFTPDGPCVAHYYAEWADGAFEGERPVYAAQWLLDRLGESCYLDGSWQGRTIPPFEPPLITP